MTSIQAPVIILLSQSALPTAESVAAALPGARIHGLADRVSGVDERFEHVGLHLRTLFLAGTPIVGVCAAAVLIRSIAQLLVDKTVEPPVLAVAENGGAVVPLLGGHHGANDIARTVAAALGCEAAITTAGDIRFGVALDQPPHGWTLANPQHAKSVTAALLSGVPARIEDGPRGLNPLTCPVPQPGLWFCASRIAPKSETITP
ncbi:hypothetical protein CCP2SC5_950010 [Azospirillaceae bacterium]